MTGKKMLDKLILKLLNNYVDRIVFLSEKTKNEFISQGIDVNKCSVLYNFSTVEYTESEINLKKHNKKLIFSAFTKLKIKKHYYTRQTI